MMIKIQNPIQIKLNFNIIDKNNSISEENIENDYWDIDSFRLENEINNKYLKPMIYENLLI